jgi:4-diphosphocytidyl-2-C-methyl-D-erythritol kinase
MSTPRLARVRATAYPKLTLSLRVTGVRDDGFHDLDALVVSLGQPHDVLEAYAVPAPGGVQVEVDADSPERAGIPTDHTNLAFVAAEKLLVRAGRSGHGVRIVLRKRIPAGAGLGGGSADAAAALLAVRRLLDVDVDDAGVLELAAEVGSDVSFCIRGGAAWMRGRGELIEPLDWPSGLAFLVAMPPFRLATPDVYRAWDRLGGPEATRRVPAPRRIASLLPELRNDLEPAAEAIEPRLVEFRTALEAAAGRPALLAGSGSAYVVPVNAARDLPQLVSEVGRRLHVPVVGTTTVSRGVRVST